MKKKSVKVKRPKKKSKLERELLKGLKENTNTNKELRSEVDRVYKFAHEVINEKDDLNKQLKESKKSYSDLSSYNSSCVIAIVMLTIGLIGSLWANFLHLQ